jgi:GDPmannose 4,6-dehydratase
MGSLIRAIEMSNPDEIYHLAAQSQVHTSWKEPILTYEINALGTLRLFEAVRMINPKIKIYFAATSELYGSTPPPQDETTLFHPRSPYGISKLAGYWQAINHNESYGMNITTGIVFNTESPRRGIEFVTRKITQTAARIKLGLTTELRLGNLDSKRDWSYAEDTIRGIYLAVQQPKPDIYVFATGETHTIREFCEEAFGLLDLDYRDYVVVDPAFIRPAEVDILLGNSAKAAKILDWRAQTTFKELVAKMVENDYNLISSSLK